MTVQEAIQHITYNHNTHKIYKVSETSNHYIISIIPVDKIEWYELPIIPPIAVHKKTGKQIAFNPAVFSVQELETMRVIYKT